MRTVLSGVVFGVVFCLPPFPIGEHSVGAEPERAVRDSRPHWITKFLKRDQVVDIRQDQGAFTIRVMQKKEPGIFDSQVLLVTDDFVVFRTRIERAQPAKGEDVTYVPAKRIISNAAIAEIIVEIDDSELKDAANRFIEQQFEKNKERKNDIEPFP